MKKTAILLLITAILGKTPACAQQNNNGRPFSLSTAQTLSVAPGNFKDTIPEKAAYLQKSKTQKIVGFSLLGGGAAMAVIGGIMFKNNFELFNWKNNDDAAAGALLFYGGAGCILASIPLFITSVQNAKKADRITMGTQRILAPQQNNLVTKLQPAVKITVHF